MTLSLPPPVARLRESFERLPGNMRGVFWVTMAVVFFGSIVLVVRHLTQTLPVAELVFMRALLSVSFTFPILFARNGLAGVRPTRPGVNFLRAASMYTGMITWFFGISMLPLAEAQSLQYTMPFWTLLMAVLFLGEKVGIDRWSAVAVGFAGTLIILRPGTVEFGLASLGVLYTAVSYSATNILTKVAGRKESPTQIVAWTYVFVLLMSAVPAWYYWVDPAWTDAPWILGLGVLSFCASQCNARAYLVADASLVTPFGYLRLPFVAGAAYLIYAEVPDMWTEVGAAVIFAAATYLARSEAIQARARRAAANPTPANPNPAAGT